MVHMDGGMAKRFLMLGLVAALAAALFGPGAWAQEAAGRRPLTEEEGRLVAQAALAYAEVEYWAGGALRKGMPYLWGGRTTVEQLLAAAAQAAEDEQAVPALAAAESHEPDGEPAEAAGQPTGTAADAADRIEDVLSGLGVDASGLVVNALRALNPSVRFAASAGDNPVWLADATSSLLYHYNVLHLDPADIRAGDFVFFGTAGGDSVNVTGVGVVTGRSGTRVDFVVASAREGRVIATFARTDGDYWRNNIVGAGRFLMPAGM